MPSLDDHGRLAVATAVFYMPYLLISLLLTLRHGFGRSAGWVFLLIFSTVRIVGGAMLVAAELVTPLNDDLYIGAIILESVGLAPLLLCTLAFLRTCGKGSFNESPRSLQAFRLLGLLATIALILSIVGGVDASSSSASDQSSGTTLRRAGSFLFLVLYVAVVLFHFWAWSWKEEISPHHRTLLAGISCALPFLAIRLAFSVLSSFSKLNLTDSTSSSTSSSDTGIGRFNIVTGDWWIFLVMVLVMEYIVVGIYMLVGTLIPTQKDDTGTYENPPRNYELGSHHGRRYAAV